uniref:Uncharacterized protein n=1 Tax=Lepeophtheirus salmonis TaxID=72036 RepID=A0A0K2TN65_LEPSM
MPVPTEKGLT